MSHVAETRERVDWDCTKLTHRNDVEIPQGWRRLHEIAITLNGTDVEVYEENQLGELFGVAESNEGQSERRHRTHVVEHEESAVGRSTRHVNNHDGAVPKMKTPSVHRPRIPSALEVSDEIDRRRNASELCRSPAVAGQPIPRCRSGDSPGGDQVKKPPGMRLTYERREHTATGPPHREHQLRWSYGCCATEVRESARADDRVDKKIGRGDEVRPAIMRPPRRLERAIAPQKPTPCWTKTALLYIRENGSTQCVAVKVKEKQLPLPKIISQRKRKDTHSVPNRAVGRIARRLNRTAVETLKVNEYLGDPRLSSARDGPPRRER